MRLLLPSAVAILAISIMPAIVNPIVRHFGNVAIVPYERGISQSFSYTFYSTEREATTITVLLTNKDYSNLAIYQRLVSSVNVSITDQVTIPGSLLNGLSINLKFQASGENFASSKELTVTAIDDSVVDPTSDDGMKTFVANGQVATISEAGGVKYFSEKLSFLGFTGLSESLSHQYLDFGDLVIDYDCEYNGSLIAYQKADFYLDDPFGCFPNLPYDEVSKCRHIQAILAYDQTESVSRFALSDKLYVDPLTLMMSVKEENGYAETAFLYFPKNTYSSLKLVSYRIVISGVGINDLTISYNAQHYAANRFFGDCINSSYCVSVNQDPLDIGYETSHKETTNG